MPTLLVLGASVSQIPIIRRARAAGLRVVVVDGDPDAVGFAEADVAAAVDFSDVEGVVEVARAQGADAVVAVSTDRAVPVAAAVAERLGLPGIGADVALVMSNKAAMRARLAEQHIPQPEFFVLEDPADARDKFARLGAPSVLKPVDSGGQRGVVRVDTVEQLEEALPAVFAESRSGLAIVERYIEGGELNGIVVARNGELTLLSLSDRLRPGGRGFAVGWAHGYPSMLPGDAVERAADVATRAVAALGLQDGIAFPQLLVSEAGEVVVVEVAARIPAGQMADLVRHAVGVDLFEIALLQIFGQPVPTELVEKRFSRPVAIRFLTADPGPLPVGELVSIEGLERVRAAPGVLEASLYLRIGETINPVQVDADRRGYVIATGESAAASLQAADAAARELVVVTR